MAELSVCAEMIFRELPFAERFAAIKKAGFDAAEIWSYTSRTNGELLDAAGGSGVILAAMCAGSRDEALAARYGSTPLVCDGSYAVFPDIVAESLDNAKYLGVKKLIATTGNALDGTDRRRQHENIVRALSAAAPLLRGTGVQLVLEPLNTLVNHRGYYLSSSHEAAEIIRETGSPDVKILFDIYHQQVSEGNIIDNITSYIELIGHFHMADCPGRHEPGTGELNWKTIFAAIDSLPYSGYIGLEFEPSGDSASALTKVKSL